MIDLDIEMTEKLCRYEIERAERSGESVNPYCLHHAPAHAMLELITRLRQAEKDAARYRWMRDTGFFDGSTDDLFHATPEQMDAEFDRIMQCEQ